MQLAKREFAQQSDNTSLRDFLLNNEDKVRKLVVDLKKANVSTIILLFPSHLTVNKVF